MKKIFFPAEELRKELETALEKEGIKVGKKEIVLEHPANKDYGDYATNVALVLAAKKKTSPRKLAEKLAARLKKEKRGFWEKVVVAGPGFINFTLKKDYFFQITELILKKEFLSLLQKEGKGKTIVIDYSSPNIAKPFGIGHLRSTNIGQAIYNLYQILGWKTIGDNHLGDWGTQFGKLIYQIKAQVKGGKVKELTIEDLERLYVDFHREAEENPQLEEEARQWFKKLEEGDREAKEIWQACVDISLREFDRLYRLLGVKFDYFYGESFYYFQGWMDQVLDDLRKKGLLKKSRGAWVAAIPGQKIPALLIKSDGATTYLLRDLAAIKFRVKKWRPDLVIYEVGADQKFHFQQLFLLAERLGYISKEKLVHVAHGLIRWEKGKFSTRRGKTIHLEEVIKEALERAKNLLESSQTGRKLGKKEKEEIARAVAIGGIKFNDLKQEPEKDIIFSWEKILALEGYSAPYLQYTAARCFSVLRKSRKSYNKKEGKGRKLVGEEEDLFYLFYQFPEIIKAAAENFAPHLLAQYLFSLAQKFNLFYQKRRIIGSREESFRLFLTAITARILKIGLGILGIEVLERM